MIRIFGGEGDGTREDDFDEGQGVAGVENFLRLNLNVETFSHSRSCSPFVFVVFVAGIVYVDQKLGTKAQSQIQTNQLLITL